MKRLIFLLPVLLLFIQGCQNPKKKYMGLWVIQEVKADDSVLQNLIGKRIGLTSKGGSIPSEKRYDLFAKWEVSSKDGKEIITFSSEGYFQGDFDISFINGNSCWVELKNDEFSVQMHQFACENLNRAFENN